MTPHTPSDEARELLGEALFALSAQLATSGFLKSNEHHATYERVVAAFEALTPTEPLSRETVEQMRDALMKAAERFREYEAIHAAKVDEGRSHHGHAPAGALAKEQRNREMAELCERALSSSPPSTEPVEGEIERVARAIQNVKGGVNYDYADFCRDAARAAISSLKEGR